MRKDQEKEETPQRLIPGIIVVLGALMLADGVLGITQGMAIFFKDVNPYLLQTRGRIHHDHTYWVDKSLNPGSCTFVYRTSDSSGKLARGVGFAHLNFYEIFCEKRGLV